MNILLGLALAAAAAAQTANPVQPPPSSATPDLAPIVDRLERAQAENRAATRAYVVTRDYQLFKEGEHQPQSTVIAEVSFLPPDRKSYEIRQSSGTGTGEKVVRKVLNHEKEMADDRGEHDLSRKNYEFTYVGMGTLNGARCYVLHLHPTRADKNLLEGLAWIDSTTFLPRRVEGTPSKSPSWWVKDLQLRMDYGPVAGMWLPLGNLAKVDIRIFGKHTFVARDLEYQTSEAVARASRSYRRNPAANAGIVFLPE